MGATDFIGGLDSRAAAVLDACTRCGKCFEACPMAEPAGLAGADSKSVVSGVLDILRRGDGPADSRRWAEVCTNSGFCLSACDYGVDPRFMLLLARFAMKRGEGEGAGRRAGVASFKDMTRATRVLPRLQLSPEELARISSRPWTGETPPDLIFYTGCNLLRTPHIALFCLDVLDALGLSYAVYGGPGNCCGILQFRPGDGANGGRQAYATIQRFAETGASEVVSWCPTCQIQIGQTALPIYNETEGDAGFDMSMMAIFLARHLDRLKPLFVNRIERRVGLHEHPGTEGVTEAVRSLLEAIPGLEFVDLEQPRVGYMCNVLSTVPDYKRDLHAQQLEAAAEAGVDTLAGIYHACHRDLCSHERDWPFEVVNFMELIGAAMGFEHADVFKRLKVLQDADAILAESREMIALYGLDEAEVREVVVKNLLGEQPLPLRGVAGAGE